MTVADGPLYAFRVILDPKQFPLQNASSQLRVYRDRLEIEKPAPRSIALDDIDTVRFEQGRVHLVLGEETIPLGVTSSLSPGSVDADESRTLAAVIDHLKNRDEHLLQMSLVDFRGLQSMRRRQGWLLFLILVSGSFAATMLETVSPLAHWTLMAASVGFGIYVLGRNGRTHDRYLEGCRHLVKGSPEAAAELFGPLVEANPGWIELRANYGVALMQAHRYAEADRQLGRVLELEPAHPQRDVIEGMIRRCALLS